MTAPELSAEERAIVERFEAAPAAEESWFPNVASEGPFGPEQISHRARDLDGTRYITGCGKVFDPDLGEWGVGGWLDGDEWPPINCVDCPQPIRPSEVAEAATKAQALREAADWLESLASPTLNGDPFIRAADWAARLLRERAAVAGTE